MKKRILLIGGGSGGHIMPNLAIANILSNRGSNGRSNSRSNGGGSTPIGSSTNPQRILNKNIDILYIGSRGKLDRELVESAGLNFKAIFTGKLRRYFSGWNFIDPFFIIIGFFQSLWILIRFWPHVVFSKGGFVSVPVVMAAFLLRRKIILHESDSVMGLANRICSRLSKRVCISFPLITVRRSQIPNSKRTNKFQIPNVQTNSKSYDSKYVLTGNPVRLEIQNGDPEKGYQLTGLQPKKPILLVWGGSQGAQQINDIILKEFNQLKSEFQIIHITGPGKRMDIQDENYVQYEYIGDELKHIYAIADVVFGRAGANSLYELALMRKPNILLPIQKADQLNNAVYFEQKGASVVLRDQALYKVLSALWKNSDKIKAMKKALGELARPKATEEIATLIISNCSN